MFFMQHLPPEARGKIVPFLPLREKKASKKGDTSQPTPIVKGAEIAMDRGVEAEIDAEYLEGVLRENIAALTVLIESHQKHPAVDQDPEFVAQLYRHRARFEQKLASAQGTRQVGRSIKEVYAARAEQIEIYAHTKEKKARGKEKEDR